MFRINTITIVVDNSDPIEIDLSSSVTDNNPEQHDYFSLLIGRNGVGKSSILRGIVDFFVDFENFRNRFSETQHRLSIVAASHIWVKSVTYTIDGEYVRLTRKERDYAFIANDEQYKVSNIKTPEIVASCFGLFDKFPTKNVLSLQNPNRYNIPTYTYVGSKASGNMFSAAAVIFQMLSFILNIQDAGKINKMNEVLGVIGYDNRISFSFSIAKHTHINTFDGFIRYITNMLEGKQTSRKTGYADQFKHMLPEEQEEIYGVYRQLRDRMDAKKSFTYDFLFDSEKILMGRDELKTLYVLRQLGFITKLQCTLYRKDLPIRSNNISSGEFNLLCTILGAMSAAEKSNAIVLIDEPEISQHPNWQMRIISLLDKVMYDCNCHFIISTHSHFLVSDLPRHISNVTCLYQDYDALKAETIPEETYGWSAEEVLLKVFRVSTTRNIYLANMVGLMLDKIAHNQMNAEEVHHEISFLSEVVQNMSDIDPMKKIISTILKAFRNAD